MLDSVKRTKGTVLNGTILDELISDAISFVLFTMFMLLGVFGLLVAFGLCARRK